LAPPWPTLVIAIGRRSVPVARWVRRVSGERARLVHLGRPRAPYAWFDLIVTTPQYALPARPNVLTIPLPLAASRQICDGEAFSDLPRPRIAVLAGGDIGPWHLGDAAGLGRAASHLARRHGGSLLLTTSRRTGEAATEALIGAIDAPARVHRYGQGANPYPAILAGADAFVVTTDSVSMMADAAATGRTLLLFEAVYRPTLGQRVAAAAQCLPGYDAAVDLGLIARPRALDRVAESLIGAGHARRFDPDDALAPPAVAYDGDEIKARVVARVRALVEGA
jgi:mitochondrial fission protein ELM1